MHGKKQRAGQRGVWRAENLHAEEVNQHADQPVQEDIDQMVEARISAVEMVVEGEGQRGQRTVTAVPGVMPAAKNARPLVEAFGVGMVEDQRPVVRDEGAAERVGVDEAGENEDRAGGEQRAVPGPESIHLARPPRRKQVNRAPASAAAR